MPLKVRELESTRYCFSQASLFERVILYDTDLYSLQVISRALNVWDLTMDLWNASHMKDAMDNPMWASCVGIKIASNFHEVFLLVCCIKKDLSPKNVETIDDIIKSNVSKCSISLSYV